jgi:predicted anti-sigma-YlaC factor YlaD
VTQRESSRCPASSELVGWIGGELGETERARIAEHLAVCAACGAEASSFSGLAFTMRAHSRRAHAASTTCLDEEALAIHLEGNTPASEAAHVRGHLASCVACRVAFATAADALRSLEPVAPQTPVGRAGTARRGRLGWMAVAAAAVLAGLLVVRPAAVDRGPEPTHRDGADEVGAPAGLQPIGEVAGIAEFRWAAVPAATLYRVTVYDRLGEVVMEAETGDLRMAAPEGVLEPGGPYYWTVAARVGLTRWTTSRLIEFTLAQP